MIIGFTGTRNGMTPEQRETVYRLLGNLWVQACFSGIHMSNTGRITPIRPRAVHGDCVGADADFDELCRMRDIKRRIRPCTYKSMRAFCDRVGAEVASEEKPPMQRNRDIVADADILIACPPNTERIKKGSGTWATIGFAERKKIPVYVVFPDGSIRGEK